MNIGACVGGRFVLLMRILDVSRGNQRICRISTATQAARLQGLVLPEVARPIRDSTSRDRCPWTGGVIGLTAAATLFLFFILV